LVSGSLLWFAGAPRFDDLYTQGSPSLGMDLRPQ